MMMIDLPEGVTFPEGACCFCFLALVYALALTIDRGQMLRLCETAICGSSFQVVKSHNRDTRCPPVAYTAYMGKPYSDANLFDDGKTELVTLRALTRMTAIVQSICGRIVGMGMCSAQCPCAEFQQIGMPWLDDEIREALSKRRFDDDGLLDVRLVEDDFRRRWNKARGLVQEPLNNKLLRSGKVTNWGSRFLQSLRATSCFKDCSADDDMRLLKLTESWLRHLWDDASDNAEMITIRKSDFSEMWYVHPESIWLNDTKRRFGYRADRLYRRRISDAELREIDAILPEIVRPTFASTGKAAESDEFFKVSRICDAIFAAVEAADAPVEKYQAAPMILESIISADELAEQLGDIGISMRASKSGALEVSADDLDRLDDGIVDEMNPRTLFDDFAAAWAMTRMNTHESNTFLEQPIDGPSGTSQMTIGDLLVAPEEPTNDDDPGQNPTHFDSA